MNQLDSYQSAAVASSASSLVLAAAAGSGKTRTLVARVERLLGDGVPASAIICITFTNAGAREMERRLTRPICHCGDYCDTHHLGSGHAPVALDEPTFRLGYCGTLHGFCLRLLQRHGKLVGLPDTITVMDEDEATAALLAIRDELGVKCPDSHLPEALDRCRKVRQPHPDKVEVVAMEFLARERQTGELSFDSLLAYGLALIKHYPDTVASYTHLLVDEAQDSAPEDWAIYDALPCASKIWVGDDSQAIYGFRGGDVRQFVARSLSPGVELLKLPTNYRSAVRIVELANKIISHNRERIDNPSRPRDGAPGGLVTVRQFESPAAELNAIAATVAAHRQSQPQDSIAVLWRTNAMADQCREFLQGLGIPVAERKRSPKQEPGRRVGIAFLRMIANPWSDKSTLAFVEARDGKDAALKLHREALEGYTTPNAKFEEQEPIPVNAALPQDAREWVANLYASLPEGATAAEALLAAMRPDEQQEQVAGAVTVGTVHSVKGLEFDAVHLGGLEDEAWPGRDTDEDARRLLYVAVTRAKLDLHLSWCMVRPSPFATWKREPRKPSRFLKEVGL